MEKNNEQQTEVIVKKVQPINFFAALAISIVVAVILVCFLILATTLSGQMSYDYNDLFGFASILLAFVFFICLPILVGSRYRWKTVVATYVFQAILLFLAVFVIGMITANSSNSDPEPLPYYDDSPVLNGAAR